MSKEEFEQVISNTLENLPLEFRKRLDHVVISVEENPTIEDRQVARLSSGSTLLGLFRGVPLTEYGASNVVLPSQIAIFRQPLLAASLSNEDLKKNIKDTVLHEIGHYFGMSEEEISKWKKRHRNI